MARDFVLTIHDSERAAVAERVYGSPSVCVKSPFPQHASLPGFDTPQLVYELDLALLTPEQRERLVLYIAETFDYAPEEVRQSLDQEGFPILAEGTAVVIHNPQRWI